MKNAIHPSEPVLIVDDQPEVLISFSAMLKFSRINNIASTDDSRSVINLIECDGASTIILDLSMPHLRGDVLLPMISRQYPDIPVIIVTGENEVETAVHCMKEGAFDYLVKPVEKNKMIGSVKRAIEIRELKRENSLLRQCLQSKNLTQPRIFADIITRDSVMHSIFRYIETIAKTRKPVLITGETGTGKELIAAALHKLSGPELPFVTVNVAGLDDDKFSDTLFGHKRGAYTGADEPRKGLVEQADIGILFLDEIGELSTASQIKLLRLLQNDEYLPLGSDIARKSKARIVTATNKNPDDLQHSKDFRKDLYYRLMTHHINLPPLRNRLDDIPLLLDYFLDIYSRELDIKKPNPSPEIINMLKNYHYPGNIREFQSILFEALNNHQDGSLTLEWFSNYIAQHSPDSPAIHIRSINDNPAKPVIFPDAVPTLKEVSRYTVLEAMRRADGNQRIAAGMLGISQPALSKRLKAQS